MLEWRKNGIVKEFQCADSCHPGHKKLQKLNFNNHTNCALVASYNIRPVIGSVVVPRGTASPRGSLEAQFSLPRPRTVVS